MKLANQERIFFIVMVSFLMTICSSFADNNINQNTGTSGTIIVDSPGANVEINPSPPSFFESALGNYKLSSFAEKTINGISHGIEINEGSLTIDNSGKIVWTVVVRDRYNANNGPLKIKSTGTLSPQKKINPKKGGQFNNTTWIGNNWQIDMAATELTIRGWSTGKGSDTFHVSVDGGFLEMSNSRGTFNWVKN